MDGIVLSDNQLAAFRAAYTKGLQALGLDEALSEVCSTCGGDIVETRDEDGGGQGYCASCAEVDYWILSPALQAELLARIAVRREQSQEVK